MPEADTGALVPTVEPYEGADGFFDLLPGVDRLPVCVAWRREKGLALALLGPLAAGAWVTVELVVGGHLPHGAGLDRGLVALGLLAVIAVVAAIRAFTLRRQWTFFSDHLEFDERWLLRRREWTEPLDGYRGVAVKQQREEPDKQPLHVLTLVHAYTKRRNVVLSKTPDLAGFRKAQGRYARLLGVPGLIETGVGLEARAPDDVDRPVRERVATGTLADSFDPLGKPPGRRLSVAIEGDALLLRVRPGLGKGGIVVPVALFALWAMLDAITWAPGTSAAYRFAEFVPLTAGVLATIVLILLTDELRVSPRRIEKRWRMPWGWGIGGAIILAGGVTDVHVAKKGPGLWRSRTVQMVADADILHFGGALDHDAKVWVRDCIVAVISK